MECAAILDVHQGLGTVGAGVVEESRFDFKAVTRIKTPHCR